MNWKQDFGKGTEFNVHKGWCLVKVTQVSNLHWKSETSARSSHLRLKVVHEGPPRQTDVYIYLRHGEELHWTCGALLPERKKEKKSEEIVEKSYKNSQEAGSVQRQYRHCLQLELQAWVQGGPAKISRPGVCKRADQTVWSMPVHNELLKVNAFISVKSKNSHNEPCFKNSVGKYL